MLVALVTGPHYNNIFCSNHHCQVRHSEISKNSLTECPHNYFLALHIITFFTLQEQNDATVSIFSVKKRKKSHILISNLGYQQRRLQVGLFCQIISVWVLKCFNWSLTSISNCFFCIINCGKPVYYCPGKYGLHLSVLLFHIQVFISDSYCYTFV